MAVYRAIKCPCGNAVCDNWMVDPVAAVQGVSFTKQQAEDVAALLNGELAGVFVVQGTISGEFVIDGTVKGREHTDT